VMQQHTFPIKRQHSVSVSAKHSQITFSHFLIFSSLLFRCSKLNTIKMSLNFFLPRQFLIIWGILMKKYLQWEGKLICLRGWSVIIWCQIL
jgi:hypothetical protein